MLDMMGNTWELEAGAITVTPAGADAAVAVPAPSEDAATTHLVTDFEGFVWCVAGGALHRLNPRGAGYTDSGMGKRGEVGAAPVDCVGEWDGNASQHREWLAVALPSRATALAAPTHGDHVVVSLEDGGAQAVTVDVAGAVQTSEPPTAAADGWRALPGVLPCGNHDIAATSAGGKVYVAGGALWWRGYPAETHMFDELWCFDPAQMESADAWSVVSKLPSKIAFSGLAALGDDKLYCMGGCKNSDGIPNLRSDEQQLWIYDIATGAWSDGPPMLVPRQEVAALELCGRIYAFGCDKSCESIGVGDTAWKAEAECPLVLGGKPDMAGQYAAAAIGDTAYFAGPFGLLSFDAAAGAWAELPSPPNPGACPLTASHKGKVYVMAGFYLDEAPGRMCTRHKNVQIYDPETSTWSEGPALPSCEAWGAAISLGDTLITAGGAHWSRSARTFVFDNRCFALS